MNCHRLERDNLLSDLGATLDAHVPQCEDCSERLRGYEQIASWIAQGSSRHQLPPGWERQTLDRIRAIAAASPGPTANVAEADRGCPVERVRSVPRRRILTAAMVAAPAALALLVFLRTRPPSDIDAPHDRAGPADSTAARTPRSEDRLLLATTERAMRITDSANPSSPLRAAIDESHPPAAAIPRSPTVLPVERRFDAHAGQIVEVEAQAADARYIEIRVYRAARDLVLRCPEMGPPDCDDPDDSPVMADDSVSGADPRNTSFLRWRIPWIGMYQVTLLVSRQPIAAPLGDYNHDIAAALATGAEVTDMGTIHVH